MTNYRGIISLNPFKEILELAIILLAVLRSNPNIERSVRDEIKKNTSSNVLQNVKTVKNFLY